MASLRDTWWSKHYASKTYGGGVEGLLCHSLPGRLMEVSGQLNVPAASSPEMEPPLPVPIEYEAEWASGPVRTLKSTVQ
jgi:hypothetical protein